MALRFVLDTIKKRIWLFASHASSSVAPAILRLRYYKTAVVRCLTGGLQVSDYGPTSEYPASKI